MDYINCNVFYYSIMFGFEEKCNKIKERFTLKEFKSYEDGTKKYTFYTIKIKNKQYLIRIEHEEF